MLYDTVINGETRKVVGHFGRNGFFYSLDRTNGSFIKGGQYVNDLNWTKGLDPKTGKPVEYDPKLDVQTYVPEARALRGDGMKRTCPTWHGGVAHQPPAYNPVKHIAYGVGAEGCFSQNGAKVAFKGPERRHRRQGEREAHLHQRSLLRRRSPPSTPSTTRSLAKAITDIEIRSGALDTAGGVVFTATAGRLGRRLQRRDARGAVALQCRHAAQGRAGDLRDRTQAVSRGADERPAPASGQVRQPGGLELSVRVRAELRS